MGERPASPATRLALACVVVCALVACGATAAKPPNIVVVLTDDQGYGDTQYTCANDTAMCARTPNLAALANSPHTALFSRFYSGAGVCSPTRATILTGRTNMRDCIVSALPCDQEDPAPTCAQGSAGALPWSEFTIADAAKKSAGGDYATLQLGKWHLGDLWNKRIPRMNKQWPVASPGTAGFDRFLTTQAEASSSMPNCGCAPWTVNHTHPGPKPPSGYAKIKPDGDHCVVGGGYESDWAYPCTDYYNGSACDTSRWQDCNATALAPSYKVPGDDSAFIIDHFEEFVQARAADDRPFLAHLCMHSIHEPHPAMPEFYAQYQNDPDYLGTLTQLDVQIGRLVQVLKDAGEYDNTVIFYTADNGPHQGAERTDIRYSTNFMRQCKASIFEGGIRVPGLMHAPSLISENVNVTSPTTTADFLPTIMELLGVETDNPDWVMDGESLLPVLDPANASMPRSKPLVFNWGGQEGIIDNDWKLITKPEVGQCTQQPGFDFKNAKKGELFLFNLADDIHELHDLKSSEPAEFARLYALLNATRASIAHSQVNETKCASGPPTPPGPPGPITPSSDCTFKDETGLDGRDIYTIAVSSKEECCGVCRNTRGCAASDFTGGNTCHLKEVAELKPRNDGSVACVPTAAA